MLSSSGMDLASRGSILRPSFKLEAPSVSASSVHPTGCRDMKKKMKDSLFIILVFLVLPRYIWNEKEHS